MTEPVAMTYIATSCNIDKPVMNEKINAFRKERIHEASQ
jgi:hypothetical protein